MRYPISLLILAASSLVCIVPGTFALHVDPPAVNAVGDSPSAAAAVLRQSREAVLALKAFSYQAKTFGTGALSGQVPGYTAEVAAAKAEAGGWRLYTKGKADAADAVAFEIGFDGLDARSLREKDKAVVEKGVENMSDLAVFMSTQSARHPVAWELLADAPLAGDEAGAKLEAPVDVGGVPCDVIFVPVKGNDDAPGGLRLYIAKGDHLPRKIERLQAPEKEGGASKGARVLELADLKVDDKATAGTYTISIPTGYRVKAAEANKSKKRAAEKDEAAGGGGGGGDNGLLAIGAVAPDFELTDSEGKKHKLSDYKGKPVLMDFWATWCGPCKMAMPGVQKLHEKYKGKLKVFGMNFSENGDPAAYMTKKRYTYTTLLNAEEAAQAYKVSGIPCFYLIGADGKVLFTSVGFAPAAEKKLEEKIEAALAGVK